MIEPDTEKEIIKKQGDIVSDLQSELTAAEKREQSLLDLKQTLIAELGKTNDRVKELEFSLRLSENQKTKLKAENLVKTKALEAISNNEHLKEEETIRWPTYCEYNDCSCMATIARDALSHLREQIKL